MNYLERLVVGTADIRRDFERTLRDGFTVADIGRAARDLTALWETSLKGTGRNWNGHSLFAITRELAALGWTGAPELDILREINNDAKHGTSITATADVALQALVRLETRIPNLQLLVPELLTEYVETRQRQIVCAIYDYFAQGETGFAFLSAGPDDTWTSAQLIDEFQINASDDAVVRHELEQLPGWDYDPVTLNNLRSSLLESDSELWRIAVFTSPYADAHRIVAKRQHDLALLRGLHRDDHATNVLASLALVQSRSWNASGELLSPSDLVAAALSEGLVARRDDVAGLADALTTVLESAMSSVGPLTVDRASASAYARQVTRNPPAQDDSIGVLVSPEGVVFVRTR